MLVYLRSLTAVALTLTTSLFAGESTGWMSHDSIQRLQKTKECFRCNLSNENLAGANLRKVNLRAANLQGADLRRVSFKGAILEWADLRGANLEGADLSGANLENTSMSETNLQKSDLRGSNLKGADLRDVNLSRANLLGASMTYVVNTAVLCNTIMLDGTVSNRGCHQQKVISP